MKKIFSFVLILLSVLILGGCDKTEESIQIVKEFDYQEIATWIGMQTPDEDDGPMGTVEAFSELKFARITVGSDGWGGVQSPKVEIDLRKGTYYLAIRIFESHDGFKWGSKFCPTEPLGENHEWGFYLIEDNNMKWQKYVVVNLNEALQDVAEAYGNVFEGVFWVYATGAGDANVDVMSVSLILQK